MMECENGFAKDENGCTTCTCHVCSEKKCRMLCENGFKKDEYGCEICECEMCPPMQCMIECENGFKKDANGCNLCECEECPLTQCRLFCEYGKKKDGNGCDLCECEPCAPMQCMMECEHGFKRNATGCSMCDCNDSPSPCVEELECRNQCLFGRRKDHNECDTCECRENACEGVLCEAGFVCNDLEEPCDDGPCPVRGVCAKEDAKKRCGQEMDNGLCYAEITRWYFNKEEGKCKQFSYGGCGGNSNNFLTDMECSTICSDEEMPVKITVGFKLKTFHMGLAKKKDAFSEELLNHVSKWSWTKKEFIINYKVQIIARMRRDVDGYQTVNVEFDLIQGDKQTTLKEAVSFLSRRIQSHTAHFDFDGETFEADPQSLTLISHYEQSIIKKEPVNWYIILAVVLAVFLSLVAVVLAAVMCMRTRRNGGYSLQDDSSSTKSDVEKKFQNEAFGPVVVVKEDKPPKYNSANRGVYLDPKFFLPKGTDGEQKE